MSLYRVFIAFLIAGFASVSASASERPVPTDREIAAFMDSFLKRAVARHAIPGAALVVVRGGQAIHSAGYGVADLGTHAPIDPQRSLFRQGSIAKLFGWTLAMQLVDEGRLDLDHDINDYLDFHVPRRFGEPITMRHLLTHTAGFSDRVPLVRAGTRQLPIGRRLATNMPEQVYAPGSTLAYSNYGAALGAYVIERIARSPFEQLVQKRIFEPAGMTSSTFDQPVPLGLQARLVSNYSASARTPSPFESIQFPAVGALTSTPGDMGRFVAALLDRGEGPKGRILTPAAIDAMTRLQRPLVPGLNAGLGLGFIVGEYRGVRYAGHGGSMASAATDLELLPNHGLGWTLSFNGRGYNGSAIPLRQELLRAVIDRFYAASADLPTARGPSTADEVAGAYVAARRVHSGPLQLASMLSVDSTSNGELRIELEGGPTRWLPMGRDTFVEAKTGLQLAVARDRSGRILRLASPLLNNVTEYEPAPLHLRAALPILLVAPPLLLLAGFGFAVAALVRWRQGRKAAASQRHWTLNWLRRLRGPALALVLVTLLAWFAYFAVPMIVPRVHETATALQPLVELLSLACCAAAAIMLADALLGWRDSSRHAASKIASTLAAIAAASIGWLLVAFGLARLPIGT